MIVIVKLFISKSVNRCNTFVYIIDPVPSTTFTQNSNLLAESTECNKSSAEITAGIVLIVISLAILIITILCVIIILILRNKDFKIMVSLHHFCSLMRYYTIMNYTLIHCYNFFIHIYIYIYHARYFNNDIIRYVTMI